MYKVHCLYERFRSCAYVHIFMIKMLFAMLSYKTYIICTRGFSFVNEMKPVAMLTFITSFYISSKFSLYRLFFFGNILVCVQGFHDRNAISNVVSRRY